MKYLKEDEHWMRVALQEAQKAFEEDELSDKVTINRSGLMIRLPTPKSLPCRLRLIFSIPGESLMQLPTLPWNHA
jgi:hypothetical protein